MGQIAVDPCAQKGDQLLHQLPRSKHRGVPSAFAHLPSIQLLPYELCVRVADYDVGAIESIIVVRLPQTERLHADSYFRSAEKTPGQAKARTLAQVLAEMVGENEMKFRTRRLTSTEHCAAATAATSTMVKSDH